MNFEINIAAETDVRWAEKISELYFHSAKQRGTGIAVRKPEYIAEKISNGNAIIAHLKNRNGEIQLAGFCYIEDFEGKKYVSNSGLIVAPIFRGAGLAKAIKERVFQLARDKYPDAQVFGITTSDRVMRINSELGYRPVAFSKLTTDDAFWKGCSSCPNYDILQRNNRKMCLCTGMLALSKNEQMKLDLTDKILKNK